MPTSDADARHHLMSVLLRDLATSAAMLRDGSPCPGMPTTAYASWVATGRPTQAEQTASVVHRLREASPTHVEMRAIALCLADIAKAASTGELVVMTTSGGKVERVDPDVLAANDPHLQGVIAAMRIVVAMKRDEIPSAAAVFDAATAPPAGADPLLRQSWRDRSTSIFNTLLGLAGGQLRRMYEHAVTCDKHHTDRANGAGR